MVLSREEQGIIVLYRYDMGILFPCSLLRTSKRMILHNRKSFHFCQVVKSSRHLQVKGQLKLDTQISQRLNHGASRSSQMGHPKVDRRDPRFVPYILFWKP